MNLPKVVTAAALAAAFLLPTASHAQGVYPFYGAATAGHLGVLQSGGGPSVTGFKDAGTASGSCSLIYNCGITDMPLMPLAPGLLNGTYNPLAIYDNQVSTGNYHSFTMGYVSGVPTITLGSSGTAGAVSGLNFVINGNTYQFPGAGNGNVSGPVSSTVGRVAVWNGSGGTLLADPATNLTAYNPLLSSDGFSVYTLTGANGAQVRPTTWQNSVLGGAYAYLNQAAMVYSITNLGQPAVLGASRSSNTLFPNTCCAIGLAANAVNDNTAHVQTTWPLYSTGARLTSTGTLVNEIDVFNAGSDYHDVNPNTQPNGSALGLAIQAGGEPAVTTTAGSDVAALLYLASNSSVAHPQYIQHGIVFNFVNALFNPAVCTLNCPIVDTFAGTEIRWVWSGSDNAMSFVRGNNFTATNPSGIVMDQTGINFKNGAGGALAAVAYAAGSNTSGNAYPIIGTNSLSEAAITINTNGGSANNNLRLSGLGTGSVLFGNPVSGGIVAQVVTNSTTTSAGYVSLSISSGDALIAVGSGNGATNANLQLNALGTGHVIGDADFDTAATHIYRVQGTAGVSCSGSPTASFATIGGITTHC